MSSKYKYDTLEEMPSKHRWALVYMLQGAGDEDIADVLKISIETVAKIRSHPFVEEQMESFRRRSAMNQQRMQMAHEELVSKTMDLNTAALNALIEYDEEGTPKLKTVIDSKGDVTTPLKASTLNKLLESAFDHDPHGRFRKKSTAEKGKITIAIGGEYLHNFKKRALLNGFTPPKVLDADFEVMRDGNGVIEASGTEVIDGIDD